MTDDDICLCGICMKERGEEPISWSHHNLLCKKPLQVLLTAPQEERLAVIKQTCPWLFDGTYERELAERQKEDDAAAKARADKAPGTNIRDLQQTLPWTIRYHKDFRASPVKHKDFQHAHLHVVKALGKIATIIDEAEHGGNLFERDDLEKYLADLVICAMRMANTSPGGVIDLQSAVEDRIVKKNPKPPATACQRCGEPNSAEACEMCNARQKDDT